MRKNDVYHEFEGTIEHQTEKAYLFWKSGDEKPDWLPKSQVKLVKPSGDDGPAVLALTEWIAKQKGWV